MATDVIGRLRRNALRVLTAIAAITALGGCAISFANAHSANDRVAATSRPTFTAAQAARGGRLFEQHCAACHNFNASMPEQPVTLAGADFVRRWHDVRELYHRISLTMPADKLLSLTNQQYSDVTAYLLSKNGYAAGFVELPADSTGMQNMLLGASMPPSAVDTGKGIADGYYSLAQALRGRSYFEGSCSECHNAVVISTKPDKELDPLFAQVTMVPSRGMLLAGDRMIMGLAGPGILDKWTSVGAYFRRIRATMPGHRPAGLSDQTYRDIVAYLLQANGVSAGSQDLPDDVQHLDALPILEPGFKPLYNGRDFDGLRFLIGEGCTPQPEGCGSIRPEPTFSIKNGVINTVGYPHGFMYTAKKYHDFDLRLEYRMTPDPNVADGDVYWGNSGYLLFIEELAVFPRMLEIQAFDVIQLRPLPIGGTATYTYDREAMQRAHRPIGQWSDVRIESRNGQIRATLNGILVSVVSKHDYVTPGHIGFQSENANISWRNIRIKEY